MLFICVSVYVCVACRKWVCSSWFQAYCMCTRGWSIVSRNHVCLWHTLESWWVSWRCSRGNRSSSVCALIVTAHSSPFPKPIFTSTYPVQTHLRRNTQVCSTKAGLSWALLSYFFILKWLQAAYELLLCLRLPLFLSAFLCKLQPDVVFILYMHPTTSFTLTEKLCAKFHPCYLMPSLGCDLVSHTLWLWLM